MKKVLIIEDNQILAENFARILRKDFIVLRSSNASDAISQIDTNPPDLIFLDILLDGHSAFALLHELQSYYDTAMIPVVVCSDLADNLEEKPLKEYGIKAILDKAKTSPKEILEVCRNATR